MYLQWMILFSSLGLILAGWIPERIVGGHSVSISSVPWQASLQRYGSHACGAVIYSDQIVLTAAHCVLGHIPFLMAVRVGSSNSNYGGQLVRVSRVVAHENYHNFANDIAVLRLQRPLVFDSNVRPIPLAKSSPECGSSVSVSGWGSVGWGSPMSTSLLRVTVDVVDQDTCSTAYEGAITDDMICAAASGRDACGGDSGGPLVSDGQLVGIVSFGVECAHAEYPGVYADVAHLKPWILQAVERV